MSLLAVFAGGGAKAGLSVGPRRAIRRERLALVGAGVQYATFPEPKSSGVYRGGPPWGIMVSKKKLTEEDIDRLGYIRWGVVVHFLQLWFVSVTSVSVLQVAYPCWDRR